MHVITVEFVVKPGYLGPERPSVRRIKEPHHNPQSQGGTFFFSRYTEGPGPDSVENPIAASTRGDGEEQFL
jgi:hypothetical protein